MPPKTATLLFAPTGQYVEAKIVALTTRMAELRIDRDWWRDSSLLDSFESQPIDRYWRWDDAEVIYHGNLLRSEKVAVVTGDRAVQGAMLISIDAVPSILIAGSSSLFVELLFTAPRNRRALRRDGKDFFKNVGKKLMAWAAWRSRMAGYGGLILHGSPEYVGWYESIRLERLPVDAIVYEGITYTPMELPARESARLSEQLK